MLPYLRIASMILTIFVTFFVLVLIIRGYACISTTTIRCCIFLMFITFPLWIGIIDLVWNFFTDHSLIISWTNQKYLFATCWTIGWGFIAMWFGELIYGR